MYQSFLKLVHTEHSLQRIEVDLLRFTGVLLKLRRGAALNGRLRGVGCKLQLVGMIGNDLAGSGVDGRDTGIIRERLLHLCGHDAPFRDQLAKQRLLGHIVKTFVPEARILPHILVCNLAVLNAGLACGAEDCAGNPERG